MANTFHLILVPLPPSWLWELLWGASGPGWRDSSDPLQIWAVTVALFLSIPALQNMESDSSPSVSSLALEMKQMLYEAREKPSPSSFLPALWCCLRRAERRGIPNQLV